VVTGGTSGIGLATAQLLMGKGNNVFICGRDPYRLERALETLGNSNASGRVAGITCDVRDMGSVEFMISAAVDQFEGINVLLNSAGIGFITPFDAMTPQQWHDVIDTNLTGVFNCCHAAFPWLKAAGHSDIVNMGSRAGRYAFAGGTGYNTTKFGLQGFTEALFLDLHQYGIRVSLVAPGPVATDMTDIDVQEWHLEATDVAKVVSDIIQAESRAAVNWVEMRPARPQ
jgi:3-oxoacyl-[acyl-carrier protein] reductase